MLGLVVAVNVAVCFHLKHSPASQQRAPEKNQEGPVTGRFSRRMHNGDDI